MCAQAEPIKGTLCWLVMQIALGFPAMLVFTTSTVPDTAATLIRTACAAVSVFTTIFYHSIVFLVTAFRDHATSEVASPRSSSKSLQEIK